MGMVGVGDPASGSIVTAKAFASVPVVMGGLITIALPWASGLNIPAGMGAPFMGIATKAHTTFAAAASACCWP